MNRRRIADIVAVTLLVLTITGCEETPLGPNVGSGNELSASVNGSSTNYSLIPGFSEYDETFKRGEFSGTAESPSQTLKLSFVHDIDNGGFPVTLTGGDVTINYVETVGGEQIQYDCIVGTDNCVIRLTASDGNIVDGTFTATLSRIDDTSQKVEITGGSFSVTLR